MNDKARQKMLNSSPWGVPPSRQEYEDTPFSAASEASTAPIRETPSSEQQRKSGDSEISRHDGTVAPDNEIKTIEEEEIMVPLPQTTSGGDLETVAEYKDNRTPLHQAAWGGDVELVRQLLDAGAAIEKRT